MATTTGPPVDYFPTGKLLTKIWDLHFEDSDDDDVTPLTTPTRHVPSIHDFLVTPPPLVSTCGDGHSPQVVSTCGDGHSPQAVSLPKSHHTSHTQPQVPPNSSSQVSSSGCRSEEPLRHIPSIYDFLDVPTSTHAECTVDSVATPRGNVAIPPGDVAIHLADVAMHHPTKPMRSSCWQACQPQVDDVDPLLRQSVALPAPPSLPTTHLPSHCTSALREPACSRRPLIPRLPLGENKEMKGDHCSGCDNNRECVKQSVISSPIKRSVRCKSSKLSQHSGPITCCHGNGPYKSPTSVLTQPFPRANPYLPHPWTPPLSPPCEALKLSPAPPPIAPNMAALPYELLELLLSSLEQSDLLSCRAVSRRLCAAASTRMRGRRLVLSGHNKLDSFALSNVCWLQPSQVELCHISGHVGSNELATFLRAGKECVKSLKYVSCRVMTDPGGEVCLLHHLAHHWRGLRELTIFLPAHFTERTTQTIFQHLHSLSQVSVDGSPLNCCGAIRAMATQHRLSSLSLPSHLLCRQELLCVLKDACFSHCLEELELKGITNPTLEWLVALSEVLSAFTSLKRLTLSASTQLPQDATQEVLDVVCECTSQLSHLRLTRLTAGQAALARLTSCKVTIEQ